MSSYLPRAKVLNEDVVRCPPTAVYARGNLEILEYMRLPRFLCITVLDEGRTCNPCEPRPIG